MSIVKGYAVIVIAYNRDKSLARLLDSLGRAYYPKELSVPLIISIDKSDNEEVVKIAEKYEWKHGEKSVILHKENLGLKSHVLLCGDISQDYEGIIVLEDDLFVSKGFYMYALEALRFTDNDGSVGGVSLYNHLLNVHVREPFCALDDGYDNYYFKFASSWGQAYTKSQWQEFRSWYDKNKDIEIAGKDVPLNVASWSDKSWLKYYIKYLIDTDKYFLYPRVSYTTNFGDAGTHAVDADNDLQVPLAGVRKFNQVSFCFSRLDESMAVYDAFFENTLLKDIVNRETNGNGNASVVIDLYGYRTECSDADYILTSAALPYKVIRSYGRNMRPVDANIFEEVEGKELFLYDVAVNDNRPKINDTQRYLYNYRAIKFREMKSIFFDRAKKIFK